MTCEAKYRSNRPVCEGDTRNELIENTLPRIRTKKGVNVERPVFSETNYVGFVF